jgi:hypothetical protein
MNMNLSGNVRASRACRGSTMVVVSLLLAAVAMLSLSFLMVLRSTQKEHQGSRETLSALYAAEAGLTAAMDDIATGGTGDVGSENAPATFGSQRFWVESNDIGGGRIALVSYGRDDRAQMGVELVVQPAANGFFRWAAFGDELLHMESNSRTDSYDSEAGDYASQAVNGAGSNQYANTEGDVGSNANITMDSNNQVWGDANPGPSGTVSGSGYDDGNITGSTTPMADMVELPAIIVPAVVAPGGSVSFDTQVLASGSYYYASMQVNTGRTLTINGPATIVCGNFKLKSNSNIVVNAADGPVEFFVIDDFVLNSNTSVASTEHSPLDVAFNLLSDNILDPGVDVVFDEDLVDFDSGSQLYGTIYAPSAEITIDSNFELFGSLVARRVDLDSNCRIHYDEQLLTASEEAGTTYETLCWRLISQP